MIPPSKRLRVLIADGHPAALEGMAYILKASDLLAVCGFAKNQHELIEKSNRLAPDIVIFGLELPLLIKAQVIKGLGRVSFKPRVLCCRYVFREEHLLYLIKAGIVGLVTKSISGDELNKATMDVAS